MVRAHHWVFGYSECKVRHPICILGDGSSKEPACCFLSDRGAKPHQGACCPVDNGANQEDPGAACEL